MGDFLKGKFGIPQKAVEPKVVSNEKESSFFNFHINGQVK